MKFEPRYFPQKHKKLLHKLLIPVYSREGLTVQYLLVYRMATHNWSAFY